MTSSVRGWTGERRAKRGATVMAALAIALTFVVTSALPASADSASRHDQRHDVVTFDEEGGVLHRRHTPDPDVVGTRLAHLSDRVIIRLTFANLRRDPHDRTTYGRIVTPHGLYRFRSVLNAVDDTATFSLRSSGTQVACPDLKQTARYGADRLRLSVPRTCLGGPRWVQLGVITGLERPRTFGWWDDALRDGTNLAFTPKMSRRLARAG